ncbi:MAG: response regulator transcription factor [Magnetococcales bacterium]|nr:response regulator transcription factor [Magnetococcales bacterium]
MSNSKKITLLLIDDDFALRMMIRKAMEDGDFEVIGEADHGEEGIALHRSLQPDVTLCDIEMPVMNGIEALRSILVASPSACVIMLTSVNHPEVWEDCLLAGARFYIDKGTPYRELRERVRESWAEHQKIMRS